jgi:hypothetical protein
MGFGESWGVSEVKVWRKKEPQSNIRKKNQRREGKVWRGIGSEES